MQQIFTKQSFFHDCSYLMYSIYLKLAIQYACNNKKNLVNQTNLKALLFWMRSTAASLATTPGMTIIYSGDPNNHISD